MSTGRAARGATLAMAMAMAMAMMMGCAEEQIYLPRAGFVPPAPAPSEEKAGPEPLYMGPVMLEGLAPPVPPAPLLGLEIGLRNVTVTHVAGDRVFYVTDADAGGPRELLVYIDEGLIPDWELEQRNLQAGQAMALIVGTLQPMSDAELVLWDLTRSEAAVAGTHPIYLNAISLRRGPSQD